MSQRLGAVFHWVGLLVMVIAIAGAVTWNVQAFEQRRAAQENLRSLSPALDNRQEALAAAFAEQRASTAALRRSLTAGGALAIGGLIVYGLGLAAFVASRKRKR